MNLSTPPLQIEHMMFLLKAKRIWRRLANKPKIIFQGISKNPTRSYLSQSGTSITTAQTRRDLYLQLKLITYWQKGCA